jgi:proline iminopeptidase
MNEKSKDGLSVVEAPDLFKLVKISLLSILFLGFEHVGNAQTGFIFGHPKIAYWKYGNKETVTIIINGGPGYDHTYLRPEWDTLSEISTIIYYDQRGCGESESSDNYSWIEQLKDLKRIKDHLSPKDKVFLAASSWGTNIALLYSIYFPSDVKGLIISGFTDWRGINDKKVDLFNYQIDSINNFLRGQPLSQEIISIIKLYQKSTNDHFSKQSSNELFNQQFQSRFQSMNEEMKMKTFKSLRSMPDLTFFTEITVPVLIIKGNIDCGFEDWSDVLIKKIKLSEYFIISNSCHDPWYINPKLFFSRCIEFINRINHF